MLLVKNLNPFSLTRKITDKKKREIVYMLWRECIPTEFYKHICEEQNFIYLKGLNIRQNHILEIVGDFIDQGKENIRILQEYLVKFKDIYQYVYSHIFSEIYTASEKRGFDLKKIHILFKTYNLKEQQNLNFDQKYFEL